MWTVITTDFFDEWFDAQSDNTQEKVLAGFQHRGDPIRAFFAFDPLRQAIVLCAGNKCGNEKRFYKQMIPIADFEFAKHLEELEK
ncbi:type II toxin-antitoxin system RelE/ParE family toxin [Photobacterium carnosum]|uniref:type II toxin-antitoxin system RelE/ParE family toxin n=1 Tax=Photobacterium carnosum TaxID=2023717 RepID=UPI001E5A0ED9|nr:type II toxin-antitoxin system RelE/ParE family toxin [Photobacterium carnosum]MCD9528339.1 type II toxin-antitoxin system RelE/ParE family toxin [Photobacterium carnosum]